MHIKLMRKIGDIAVAWWLDPSSVTDLFELEDGSTRVITHTADVEVREHIEVVRKRVSGIDGANEMFLMMVTENKDIARVYAEHPERLRALYLDLFCANPEVMLGRVSGASVLRRVMMSWTEETGFTIDLHVWGELVKMRDAAGPKIFERDQTEYRQPRGWEKYKQSLHRNEPVVTPHRLEKPVCFGDIGVHDETATDCQDCRWFQTCSVVCRVKREDLTTAKAARIADIKKWIGSDRRTVSKPACFGRDDLRDMGRPGCRSCPWEQSCGLVVKNTRLSTKEKLDREELEAEAPRPQPECFGDPDVFDPADRACRVQCDWFSSCGLVVETKGLQTIKTMQEKVRSTRQTLAEGADVMERRQAENKQMRETLICPSCGAHNISREIDSSGRGLPAGMRGCFVKYRCAACLLMRDVVEDTDC